MAMFEVEISQVINYLESAFGNQLSDTQMDAYVSALQRTNLVKLRAAAEKVVKENIYFPKVAELIRSVDSIPDSILSRDLMMNHQRTARRLKDRFYKKREIDWEGFDAFYQELREAGYWDKAEYALTLVKRFEDILKREETPGGNGKVVYKTPEELRKQYPEFVK